MIRKLTILGLVMNCFAVPCFAQSIGQKIEMVESLPAGDRPTYITQSLPEMINRIMFSVGDRSFSAHQFLGYSGATFSELDRYKQEFKDHVINLNKRTQGKLGSNAITVLILGATVDGFGIGYELIQELVVAKKISNVLVTGMASNEAAAYHLEGLQKGWGHVISPFQHIAYLKETYTDSQNNKSWELKTSERAESDTPKVLKDLSRRANAGFMTFNVFGGGAQAFNETLEMILESRNRPYKVEINLYVGHSPGKIAKDTGYRAADMLAYILAKNPYLLNNKIQINIKSSHSRTIGIRAYRTTSQFLELERDEREAVQKIVELSTKESTPQIKALIKYYEIMSKLKDLPLKEIENFRYRSSTELARAREKIKTTGVFSSEDTMDRIDMCLNCTTDSEKITASYTRNNLTCSALFK